MRVTGVEPGGPAHEAGVREGDELIALGGEPVRDAIDVALAVTWSEEDETTVSFLRDGRQLGLTLPVALPEELGLELSEPAPMVCGNRCVFCFVDQLPGGLRKNLYVKDEDYRLSFGFGNYITLTNLTDADYERVARQRLSPLYVSVHASDDAVRREMLGRGDAPAILESLRRLIDFGTRLHAQIVVCPGVNDGAVLDHTLRDLFELGPALLSVAVVPVGLTAHRDGLPDIEPVSPAHASETIAAVERWQQRFSAAGRDRTVYGADELYLKAGRELPDLEDYGDLPQLENGVGLLRSFERDLRERAPLLGTEVAPPLDVTVVTGASAAPFLDAALRREFERVKGLRVSVLPVNNGLLGERVTVAGLLAGNDMADAIAAAGGEGLFLLPGAAFNDDGITLDGMSAGEIAGAAGVTDVAVADDVVGALLERVGHRPSHRKDEETE